MDVYGESGRRAHRTGVVGVDAETEDTVDNLEVYEALVNPKEANSGGNKGRGGMMPPMMMGGAGAGGGSSAAASAGASQAAAVSTAGATARAVPGPMAAGTTTAAPVASPGAGAGTAGAGSTPSFGGGGLPSGGGGVPTAGLGAGVVAAQSEDPGNPGVGEDQPESPGTDPDPVAEEDDGEGGPVDGIGRINPLPPTNTDLPPDDVVEVNPAEIERLAKEWSSLSDSMTGLSTNISNLQADAGAFGMVRDPEPVYGKMTDGLSRRSGGAAAEFEQISAGLAASAAAFRATEDDATASLGGLTE
ncbi:hypothetical protein [Tessaracoccus terricola]